MMMPGSSRYDWDSETCRTLLQGNESLHRTTQSIMRSQQVAIETEQLGTEVVADLNDQRESLLRTKNRLTDADGALDQSRSVIRKIGRNALYNKIILIAIIVLELVILGVGVYLKFFKQKT